MSYGVKPVKGTKKVKPVKSMGKPKKYKSGRRKK